MIYKTLAITGIVCLSLLCAVTRAGAQADQENQELFEKALADQGVSPKEFEDLFTYYYRDPLPGKLVKCLKALLAQESFIMDAPHFMPTAHLVGTAAHFDPVLLKDLKDLEKEYTGTRKDRVAEIIAQAENFESPPPRSANMLDYLWGEFIATGKDSPVVKIISVLDDYPSKDLEKQMVQRAAVWSLTANAKQHDKVYSIIREEAIIATGPQKEILEEILRKARPSPEAGETN